MNYCAWHLCTIEVRAKLFTLSACGDITDESHAAWCAWLIRHAAGQA